MSLQQQVWGIQQPYITTFDDPNFRSAQMPWGLHRVNTMNLAVDANTMQMIGQGLEIASSILGPQAQAQGGQGDETKPAEQDKTMGTMDAIGGALGGVDSIMDKLDKIIPGETEEEKAKRLAWEKEREDNRREFQEAELKRLEDQGKQSMSILDRLMANTLDRGSERYGFLLNLGEEEASAKKEEPKKDVKKDDEKKSDWYDKTMGIMDRLDKWIPKETEEEKAKRLALEKEREDNRRKYYEDSISRIKEQGDEHLSVLDRLLKRQQNRGRTLILNNLVIDANTMQMIGQGVELATQLLGPQTQAQGGQGDEKKPEGQDQTKGTMDAIGGALGGVDSIMDKLDKIIPGESEEEKAKRLAWEKEREDNRREFQEAELKRLEDQGKQSMSILDRLMANTLDRGSERYGFLMI